MGAVPRAVCVHKGRCEPSVPSVCPGCALAALHGTKAPYRGGWWRWWRFVLLLVWHRQPFAPPFCSEMAGENPVALLWLGSTVPTSPVPSQDSVPGLHPRRGTPRTHPGALSTPRHHLRSSEQSPAWLRDRPRSSSRGAAQHGGRLARPLKRQQILLSAHSSRSVKSQSIHQQLSVVCRLQAPRCLRSLAHRVGVGGSPGRHGCAPRSGDLGPYKTGTLQASSSKVQRIGVQDSRVWG